MGLQQSKILIIRFNKGDVQALQEMYDLYKREMMGLAAGLLFDRSLAEDVLHEVFAKLTGLQGRMRIRKSLRSYLLQAVANEARTANRRESRQDSPQDSPPRNRYTNETPPEESAELDEQRYRLEWALRKLPYEQREAVLMRHYSQITFREIAHSQGVAPGAVQARYRYGLKKLQGLLGANDETEKTG